ncbi:basic helix-loop-helix transcription factor scleraxis [Exaiptasia diaphana]|uniref:BHLH domain-containing protein n=1 Tax=Exaiptasia diaphana TaxID=2652724 RepID=A0A913WPT2_EXADI|nr:basic helix-loop-helix transcription factor scleraxis [Exaiptasia diaphana]KXJ28193.1 Neurogenic differentiation factor 6-A [Exaiptasia diaphana]
MDKVHGKTLPQDKGKKKMKRRGPRLTGVSRQRRLANTRERNRVQILNANIDRLRDLIPLFPDEKKPSKTDTVRLAAEYIGHLTDILQTTEKPQSTSSESTSDELDFEDFTSDFDITDLHFDIDPLPDIYGFNIEDLFWDDQAFYS